jgi:ribosomal protein S18 acetylase RimI-like enzyme
VDSEKPAPLIAEAVPADAAEIGAFVRELWRAAGPEAPALTGATDEIIAEITAPAVIRARLGGPERRIFLAREGKRIVGFAATRRIDEATTELAGIMVHPEHQGGVGTPLLKTALAAVGEQGSRRMVVHTEADNRRAIEFYCRRGFTPDGEDVVHVEETDVPVLALSRPIA